MKPLTPSFLMHNLRTVEVLVRYSDVPKDSVKEFTTLCFSANFVDVAHKQLRFKRDGGECSCLFEVTTQNGLQAIRDAFPGAEILVSDPNDSSSGWRA